METKHKQSTENFIKNVRRKMRRLFFPEQKIMILMQLDALKKAGCERRYLQ